MDTDATCLGLSNHGIFSRADALEAGETDHSLGQALRHGVVVRLRRGMYVSAQAYAAADDTAKHLLHARAAVAAQHGRVALTATSAAALHGFAIYQQDLSVVHLLRLDAGAGRQSAAATHHHSRPAVAGHEVGELDGVPVVSPARAIWEVATTSGLEAGVVTADSGLRHRPEVAEELLELRDRFERVPGSRTARRAIDFANPSSESAGESITRVQFLRYGIPLPELQHEVFTTSGRLVGRVDFGWPGCRHLAEFDGRVKYEQLVRPGESASDQVFREKRREDELRAEGYGMSRFVWSMVMPAQARQTMAELSLALPRSRRLYVDLRATA